MALITIGAAPSETVEQRGAHISGSGQKVYVDRSTCNQRICKVQKDSVIVLRNFRMALPPDVRRWLRLAGTAQL